MSDTKYHLILTNDRASDLNAPAINTYTGHTVFPFGDRETARFINYGRPDQQTAVTEYGTDPANGSYGKRVSETDFNNSWTRYEYDSYGRVTKEITPFGDAAIDAPENLCRVTEYSYAIPGEDPATSANDDDRWRCRTVKVLGVTVAREFADYPDNPEWRGVRYYRLEKHLTAVRPEADFNATDNLVRVTGFDSENRIIYQEEADGKYQSYCYSTDPETGEKVTLETSGVAGALAEIYRIEERENASASRLTRIKTMLSGNLVVENETVTYDIFHRPLTESNLTGITVREYDNNGLTRVAAADGSVTEYGYDIYRRKVFERINGVEKRYTYDANDNIISLTTIGREGGKLEYRWTYSAEGKVLSFTDAGGAVNYYRYGAGWEETVDAAGHVERKEYFRDGNLKRILSDDIVILQMEYGVEDGELYAREYRSPEEWTCRFTDFAGREYKTLYSDGYTMESGFDLQGRDVSTVDSCGNTVLRTYSAETGLLNSETVNGRRTIYASGFWKKTDPADGAEVIVSFTETFSDVGNGVKIPLECIENRLDGLKSWSIINGVETVTWKSFIPDENGENTGKIKEIIQNSDGSCLTNFYNGANLTLELTADGTDTEYFYDEFDRQCSAITKQGENTVITTYTNDAMGRITSVTRTAGTVSRRIVNAYDQRGNLKSVMESDGSVIHYTRDHSGNITGISGDSSRQKRLYNPQGKLIRITTFKSDGKPQHTVFEYDNRGRMNKRIYPDGTSESFTYRGDGKIISYLNCRGQELLYSYDRNGNLAAINGRGLHWDFAYDSANRLIRANNGSYRHNFNYDDAGRLESENFSDIPGSCIRYTRDGSGRITAVNFAGDEIHYSYDGNTGRLASVSLGDQHFNYRRETDSGRIAGVDFASNGDTVFSINRSYNALGEIISAGETSYTLDGNGRRITASYGTGKWNYHYDEKGQLTAGRFADDNGKKSYTYSYDGIGNRIRSSEDGTAGLYRSNILNQYTDAGAAILSYDADGNMLCDGERYYQYDIFNRLTKPTCGDTEYAFEYDFAGRRIKTVKTENGVTTETRYVYHDWNVIAEYVNGVKAKTYLWGEDLSGSMNGAGGAGGLLAEINTSGIYIAECDGNGNITGYRDSSGNTAATYTYDPFGRQLSHSGMNFDYQFSSKPEICGLYYYGFRYYHPSLGRWINRDPVREDGGINLYGMVTNNTICHIDINGKWQAMQESKNKSRRIYKKEASNDTLESLAAKVWLNYNEFKAWGKIEFGAQDNSCQISVPNDVYIFDLTSLLLWNWWQYREENELKSEGYNVIEINDPTTAVALNTLKKDNVFGLVIVAHGDNLAKGGFITYDGNIRPGQIHGLKYKLGAVKVIACYAKVLEKEWRNLISNDGYLFIEGIDLVWPFESFGFPVGFKK